MKFSWLRNEVSIYLLALCRRADEIELSLSDPIRAAQFGVNSLWAAAQKGMDEGDKKAMLQSCMDLVPALGEWETLSYDYARSCGGNAELEYARGIDRVHALLQTLAKKLEINEGQKPPLP